MKKIAYFFLLFSGVATAQIVNIPDMNFKNKLISIGVDNIIVDGEIQFSEAQAVTNLDVSNSNISDLTGIETFTNLTNLNCTQNNLTALNLSSLVNLNTVFANSNLITTLNTTGLTNLTKLELAGNSLTAIDLTSLTNLTHLSCNANSLISLDIANFSSLIELYCDENNLTSLNVTGLVNLKVLSCNQNLLGSLDVHELVNLEKLDCHTNQLSSLDLTGLINLKELYCLQNQIPILDLTGLVNLEYVYCYDNLLTSLDVSFISGLKELNCDYNQLTSLDVSGLLNLTRLDCFSNQITQLNVINLPKLHTLVCDNNFITNLDLSSSVELLALLSNNNSLETLNLKNGSQETIIEFTNNSNLAFICADDFQVNSIQNQLIANGMLTTNVNSYCSFTPGGNYNTITGRYRYDGDTNGCDTNDTALSSLRIDINDGSNFGSTFSESTGNYNFYTQAGNFNVTPNLENPSWFTVSPITVAIPFANNNNNFTQQDFCIAPNGLHNDVEIAIAPLSSALPNSNSKYLISYKNKGSQTISGNITFSYNEADLDFSSSTIAPETQSAGMLTWSYNNLLPFESRSIEVFLTVNAVISSELNFSAVIPALGDEIPLDNSFNYKQNVVASQDPNTINCLQGNFVPPSQIGNYLHYMINFENTGTTTATNTVVRIIIDPTKFDINTLQLLNASNSTYTRINGNQAEFIFQNLNIDTGGHGNVLLKIKSNGALQENASVSLTADIFFDYEFPIDTGIESTSFTLNTPEFDYSNLILVYPNPTKGKVSIKNLTNDLIKAIALYDVQGRLLQLKLINDTSTVFDLTEQLDGVYFMKVTTEKGSKVEKIVKE